MNSFEVTLERTVGNLTDNNTDSENITFDTSKANMLSFNITANLGRMITLKVVPLSNITSFKMLIKTDKKPTFDEIIEQGFLYPDEIEHSLFANFKYLKTAYLAATPDQEKTIILTHNSPLSNKTFSGVYYIGLTIDLNHTETLQTLHQNYSSPQQNDSNCVDSDPPVCKQLVEVTIDIQTKELGCIYWDETTETWSSEGCEVSMLTTH